MSRWERVAELFERALELPPGERGPFLDRECGKDEALRRELTSLLDAYSPASTFFKGLEAEVVGPSLGGLMGGVAPVPAGTVLGSYEVEAAIGGGGMGVVYRARDRKLDRTVALKLIAPELAHDPEARERLVREARAAAALDDPRICAIHAIEETPDGRAFLVMPYYAGESLKQRLARGPLEAALALDIATELAEGLTRAHRAGIVHRDIKPANVLITLEGAVKILDFGLAKLATGAGPTRSGATIGTAAYMSPEQARGESTDSRSDVWSLGVVMYEMLVGRRPFQGESEAAVLYAVLEGAREPVRSLAPDVPDALERLVARMLSKDPQERPADAGEVAAALRAIPRRSTGPGASGGRAAAASGPSAPVGGVRPADASGATGTNGLALGGLRHARVLLVGWRGRVGLGAALAALAAVVALQATRGGAPRAPASDAIAVLPFRIQGDPELDYLRDGMVHLLSTKLDGVGAVRSVDAHALLASYGTGAGDPDPTMGRAAAARFGAEAFILGAVVRLGDGLELSASLYEPDGRLRARASAMAKEDADLSGAVDELVRELVAHRLTDPGARLARLAAMTTRSLPALRSYLEGEHLLRAGRPAAAVTALRDAVEADSTFGLAWYRLARAAGWIGPVELNEEAAARAVRYGGALPERTRALVSAYRVFRVGDPLEAERMYRRILVRYPDDMETLELLGEALFHNNPFFGRSTAEAREPLERALTMDPGNRELIVHLMDLAAAERRLAALDSLSDRYLGVALDDEPPTALHAYAAMRALVLEPPAARDGAMAELAEAGPDAVTDALVRVSPQLRDPALSDRLAALLTDPAHAPEVRATGYQHQAWLAAARGRWAAAEGSWRSADALHPGWTLVHRALAAALPHSPASPDELNALRTSLRAWTPPAALEDGQHDGDGEVLRSYLLGLLAWRVGDDPGVARARAKLAGVSGEDAGSVVRRPGNGTRGLAGALAATLEALDHWRADRLAEALAALDRAELRLPFHRRARSPLLEQHLNRFVRAEVLRAQGAAGAEAADAEALRWYAALEDGYFHWGAPFVGPALVAAAEIHERHGRITEAIAAYERFLALWAEADPALEAWLELARERLDRLNAGA